MAPGTKRKSQYKSDDFVASDSDDRPAKRGKGSSKPTSEATGKAEVDDNGDTFWQLTKTRRVTVSEFKKNIMVSIREYYDDKGTMKPGKKGISLPVEQFAALVSLLPQIEDKLGEKGQGVPRPDYSASAGKQSAAKNEEKEDDEDIDEPKKSNIDETSDEDE